MYSRTHIAQGRRRKEWRPVRLPDHRSDPRIRLRDEIVARQMRERSALPEGRDRTHYYLWIERFNGRIVESHSRDYPRREILY